MFSPKQLKSGLPGYQSECKMCRSTREKNRRNSAEGKAKLAEYKQTAVAKARNRRRDRSECGKAARKRYTASSKGRAQIASKRAHWKTIPGVRMMLSMQEAMRRMLKQDGYESHLLEYMQVSRAEFIAHIDRLRSPEMTWELYGYKQAGFHRGWDVDHRIPKCKYDHTDLEDVRRCWSLANLAPMWHKTNLQKTDKIVRSVCLEVGASYWPKSWNGVLPAC